MNDNEPVNDEKPLIAPSLLTVGLERCWPWSHNYSKWVVTDTVTKLKTSDDTVIAYGSIQQRECRKCGKMQMRTVWAAG